MKVTSYLKIRPDFDDHHNLFPSSISFADGQKKDNMEDRKSVVICQNPSTFETHTFKFHAALPVTTTEQELHDLCGKKILSQLLNDCQSCILLVYGSKESGKTTSLYGSNTFGLLFRLLRNLLPSKDCCEESKLTMTLSFLLLSKKEEAFDLLCRSTLSEDTTGLSSSHLNEMKIQKKPLLENLKKIALHSEQEILDLFLLAEENRGIYEMSQQNEKDSSYDTVMTVSLQCQSNSYKNSSTVTIHIIELNHYEAIQQWFETGNATDCTYIPNLIRKGMEEGYAFHLLGCVNSSSTKLQEQIKTCRFGEALFRFLSASASKANPWSNMASAVDLPEQSAVAPEAIPPVMKGLDKLYVDYLQLQQKVTHLELNPSLLLSDHLVASVDNSQVSKEANQDSELINLNVQDLFESQKQRWLLEMTLKQYEIIHFRKELELQAHQQQFANLIMQQTGRAGGGRGASFEMTAAGYNRTEGGIEIDHSGNTVDILSPILEGRGDEQYRSSSSIFLPENLFDSSNPFTESSSISRSSMTRELQQYSREASSFSLQVPQEPEGPVRTTTAAPVVKKKKKKESMMTLDDMDNLVHEVVRNNSKIRCRVCGNPRDNKCLSCSNYFGVTIGICSKCKEHHFYRITAPENIAYLMNYVDRARKKAGLSPFQIKRDPNAMPETVSMAMEEALEQSTSDNIAGKKRSRPKRALDKSDEVLAADLNPIRESDEEEGDQEEEQEGKKEASSVPNSSSSSSVFSSSSPEASEGEEEREKQMKKKKKEKRPKAIMKHSAAIRTTTKKPRKRRKKE